MRVGSVLAAISIGLLISVSVQKGDAQAAPGVFADANNPAGAPDPEKLDQIWQVDPISGQVSISIPFTTTPQGGRGPKIPFKLIYNSGSTVTLQAVGTYSTGIQQLGTPSQYYTTVLRWAPYPVSTNLIAPTGPWVTSGPYFTSTASSISDSGYNPGPPPTYGELGCTIVGPYNYTDEDGNTHDTLLEEYQPSTSAGSGLNPVCGEAQSHAASTSNTSDGSAMSASDGVVTYPDGTTFTGILYGSSGYPQHTLKDANGNTTSLAVSGSPATATATDALNRKVFSTTIPIGEPGPILAGSYTVETPSATSSTGLTYNVTFSTEPIQSLSMLHPSSYQELYCYGVCNAQVSIGQTTASDSFSAVTKISLPDNTSSYGFAYDPQFGTICKITFPTGGYVRFGWEIRPYSWTPYGEFLAVSDIVVKYVYTSAANGTENTCTADGAENQWTYDLTSQDPVTNGSVPPNVYSTVTAPDGSSTRYSYGSQGEACFSHSLAVLGSLPRLSCKEASRSIYSSGGSLLKTVAKSFDPQGKTLQEATALYDGPGPLQQLTQYQYSSDPWENVVEKDESDYYNCGSSPCTFPLRATPLTVPSTVWLRKTYIQYATNSGALMAKHIVNKPSQVLVTDGNGNPYSLTNFTYDNNGNVLLEKKCISISGTGPTATCSIDWETQYSYDATGQVTQKVEGYGTSAAATTAYTWGGQANGYLYTVTHPNGATDNYTYFESTTGQVNTHKDWNQNKTTYDYTDPLNRIHTITLPITTDGTTGASGQGVTTYNYTDTPGAFSVQEQHSITGSTATSVTKTYDGLGRLITSSTLAPASQCSSPVLVQTNYDSMSRVQSVSNPYCSTSNGATSFEYDALSRKIQTTLPDGSMSTSTYGGNATEITDPPNGSTSVQHIQQVDGLGHMTSVCEVAATSLGSGGLSACGLNIPGSGYLTTYSYDALGNMRTVNQHGLARSFSYDGLSRLLTSWNPEVGQDTYSYPGPSNPCAASADVPCSRTDARGVVTTYGYDSMSRLVSKSYSAGAGNSTGALSDLSSCYQYDRAISADSNPEGQLTAEWQQAACPSSPNSQSAVPSGAVAVRLLSNHDAMGRVLSDQQCLTAASCSASVGAFVYSYNLAGDPVQSNNGIESAAVSAGETGHTNSTPITAPSITWMTTYDVANHINQVFVQDQPAAFSPSTYLADPTLLQANAYDPFGHLTAAGAGIPNGSSSAAVSIARQYDVRARLVNETDGGSIDTSTATGSLGVITVGGAEAGHYLGAYPTGCIKYDAGTITATISSTSFNYVASASWGKSDTAASMAAKLSSAITSTAGSVVTAVPDSNNASYIDLYSTGTGAATDYSVLLSVTDTATTIYPLYLANPSFSADAQSMIGGTNSETTYGTIYSYDAGYAPNGNILAHTDSLMGTWNFSYDAVDRLATATPGSNVPSEYSGKYGCWSYDAFGNRTLEAFSTVPCTYNNPTPQIVASYNPANNQILSTGGTTSAIFSYDASGNTLYDGLSHYWYDAEGQLCAVQRAIGGAITQYVYDAGGARIARGTISSAPASYTATCAPPLGSGFTLTARYLVDQGGDQVTELNGSGTWQHSNVFAGGKLSATWDYNGGNGGLHFELTDPLGTKRVQVSALGKVEENCYSLPFGNDIGNPLPANCIEPTNAPTTADDATEHHFTQKERDTDTGNDYFFARYYSSSLGRFTSPDWSAKTDPVPYAVFADPQSLNLYAYVRNNPLAGVDADGHCMGFECQQQQDWIAQHQIGNLSDKQVSDAGLVRQAQQQTTTGDDGKPHTTETVTVTAKPSVWRRIGSWFSGATHAVSYGMTAFIITHSHSAMEGNKSSFEYWSKQSNEDIIKSLNPGGKEPMQIRMDGENARILNGNMRYSILQYRGADLSGLKPEVLPPVTVEPMIEPTIEPEIIP